MMKALKPVFDYLCHRFIYYRGTQYTAMALINRFAAKYFGLVVVAAPEGVLEAGYEIIRAN